MGFFKKILRETGRVFGISPRHRQVVHVDNLLSTINIGGQL